MGTGKFGIGPTLLLLNQQGPWSYGILAAQTWSVLGDADRDDVNQTALQPFVNLSIGGGQTLSANLEASYDWTHEQWSVPLNLDYSKVFQVDGQTLKWTIGGRAHLVGPENGPDWGLRTGITFVLPPG